MSKTVGANKPGVIELASVKNGASSLDTPVDFLVRGQRAVVFFQPSNTSSESLCAGVVLKLDNGDVIYQPAVDRTRLGLHNKAAIDSLADITNVICRSARDHWSSSESFDDWLPPFPGVKVQSVTRFSSRKISSAFAYALRVNSSLALLTHSTETQERPEPIIQRIRSTWRGHQRNASLTRYLSKSVEFGHGHGAMTIDFWGQHYGCYFAKLSDSLKHGPTSITKALGRMAQLQKLREMANAPTSQIGLFAELRPKQHELIVVDSYSAPKALWQAEQFADQFELRIRTLGSTQEAAEFVADAELKAA